MKQLRVPVSLESRLFGKSWWWCSICLLATVLALLLPYPVHADGGAPNLAYVAGTAHGISVIDIAQQRVTSTLSSAGDPHMVLLSLDGRFLYVAESASRQVTVLATKTGQTICNAHLAGHPSLLALDPSANILYAASTDTANVSALDPNTCALRQTLLTRGPVYGLAIGLPSTGTEADTQLWVAESASIALFDAQGHLAKRMALPAGPRFLTLPAGGNTAYVTTAQGTLVAIDFTTLAVRSLLSGGSFGPMDFNETTGEIYVPDRLHNQLDVLTPAPPAPQALPHEPTRVIHLSDAPQSVAITSDGQFGFVALSSGKVAMLDIPGRQLIATIDVGGSPHFIITGLYPPLIGTTPQQASVWTTVASIGAYLFVIALILGPLGLLWKYNKKQAAVHQEPEANADVSREDETNSK